MRVSSGFAAIGLLVIACGSNEIVYQDDDAGQGGSGGSAGGSAGVSGTSGWAGGGGTNSGGASGAAGSAGGGAMGGTGGAMGGSGGAMGGAGGSSATGGVGGGGATGGSGGTTNCALSGQSCSGALPCCAAFKSTCAGTCCVNPNASCNKSSDVCCGGRICNGVSPSGNACCIGLGSSCAGATGDCCGALVCDAGSCLQAADSKCVKKSDCAYNMECQLKPAPNPGFTQCCYPPGAKAPLEFQCCSEKFNSESSCN